jgi:hypothetical protein
MLFYGHWFAINYGVDDYMLLAAFVGYELVYVYLRCRNFVIARPSPVSFFTVILVLIPDEKSRGLLPL